MTWYDEPEPSGGTPWFVDPQPEREQPPLAPAQGGLSSPPPQRPNKGALLAAGALAVSAMVILGVAGALLLSHRSEGSVTDRAESKRSRVDKRTGDADRGDNGADPGDGKVVLSGPDTTFGGDGNALSPHSGRDDPPEAGPAQRGELSMDAYARRMCEEVILPGYQRAAKRLQPDWIQLSDIGDPDDLTSSEVRTLRRVLIALFDEVEVVFRDVATFNDRYRLEGQAGAELREALTQHLASADVGFQAVKEEIAGGETELLAELASELGDDSLANGSPGGFGDPAISGELERALQEVDPACTLT